MFFKLLYHYLIWFCVSMFLCIICYIICLLESKRLAFDFAVSYLWNFNGLLVPTTGFGLLTFALSTHKNIYHNLLHNVLYIPEKQQIQVYQDLENLASFKNKQKIGVPIFFMGALILFSCGYPLYGIGKFLLWLTSSTMFYAGGLMIAYLFYSLLLFKKMEIFHEEISLQENTHILELENFNLYLSTLFLGGMIALYFAFRGTLTANFTFIPPEPINYILSEFVYEKIDYSQIRNLLLYPLVLFLPATLFGGFYIRYILRKIYLNSIRLKLGDIDRLTEPFIKERASFSSEENADRIIKIRIAALDLKNKIIENNKVLPLINIKDSPSIILLIVILIQFIYQHDQTIRNFIGSILGI